MYQERAGLSVLSGFSGGGRFLRALCGMKSLFLGPGFASDQDPMMVLLCTALVKGVLGCVQAPPPQVRVKSGAVGSCGFVERIVQVSTVLRVSGGNGPWGLRPEQRCCKRTMLKGWDTECAGPPDNVNMVDFCGQTIKGDGMIVNSHADSRKYYFVSVGTDCRLTMRATALKDKVQFQFRFFLVYSLLRMSNMKGQTSGINSSAHGPPAPETTSPPGSATDPCNAGSYVQFYDGKDHHSEPLGTPLCGKTIPRPVLSTGNYLTLRLVTRGQQPRVDFVGDFTSFRIGFNTSECRPEPYFYCHNGKCIPSSLVCDDRNIDNCGDGSDQSSSPPANCQQDGGRGMVGTRTPIEAMATSPATSIILQATSSNLSCGSDGDHKLLLPEGVQPHGSTAERRSFLYLYVILALVVGVALLFWCCWSPGWFIWRISVCRFIPCCNSFCASCHLCTRSCTLKDKSRPSKVTPQSTASTVPV